MDLVKQLNLIKKFVENPNDYLDLAFYFTCLSLFDFKCELPMP